MKKWFALSLAVILLFSSCSANGGTGSSSGNNSTPSEYEDLVSSNKPNSNISSVDYGDVQDDLDEQLPKVQKWVAHEISFTSDKVYTDPVYTVDMDVKFTNKHNGQSFIQPAFWDGGKNWKVRVALTEYGEWSYETLCSDSSNKGLSGKTGKLNCVPYEGNLEIYKHGFIKTEEGTRYFKYADGTPFFYLGDTHYTLALEEIDGIGGISQSVASSKNITSQFKYIIDYRVKQGFTVIQSQPLGWYTGRTGNSWFGDAEGSIFDYGVTDKILEQFQHYDKYFAYIAQKGLVHANTQLSYPEELIECYLSSDLTRAEIEKLCRYWVARYSAYPVMWTTTQEGDNDYYGYGGCTPDNNPWIYVMDYISKYDVYSHPMSCHQENTGNTVVQNSAFGYKKEHTWYASQHTLQVNDGAFAPFPMYEEYYYNSNRKPVVNYEGRFDHFWTGSLGARAQGWVAFLNGAFGYGYGVQPIWSIVWAEYGEKTPTNDEAETYERDYNWLEGLESECGAQMSYMKKFLSKYNWFNLQPCFDGGSYYMPTGTNYSVAHDGNDLYIGYFYGKNNSNLGKLLKMKNGTYEVTWLNCRTGKSTTSTVNITNNSYKIPSKGDSGDWAIAVKFKG